MIGWSQYPRMMTASEVKRVKRDESYKLFGEYVKNQKNLQLLPNAKICLETYIQLDKYLNATCTIHVVMEYLDDSYNALFQKIGFILPIERMLLDNIALCEKLNDRYIIKHEELIMATSKLLNVDKEQAIYILNTKR